MFSKIKNIINYGNDWRDRPLARKNHQIETK
jgi:hypothetical protein